MDSVPFLRHGVGSTPRDGGCIMQVIDWIHRTQWSDAPPCVHPVLRTLAIRANDSLDDPSRQPLLDLVPRLMNTATKDRRVTVGLATWCARAVLHLYESRYPGDLRPRRAIEADERGEKKSAAAAAAADAAAAYAADAAAAYAADAAASAARAAASAARAAARAAAYAASAAASAADAAADAADAAADAAAGTKAAPTLTAMTLLRGALDEYDRLTGRTTAPATPDYTAVCAVMAGTSPQGRR